MPNTVISFEKSRILINNTFTYSGRGSVEGCLFNVRTVNATFDDTLGQVSWWDDDGSHPENGMAGYGKWKSPDSAFTNTDRFIGALHEYRDWGILAINLSFQGGHPLQTKLWIPEGRGSAGKRPNGHRDFYHNSGFRSDGSIDAGYAQRISSTIETCDRLGMAVILQLFYFGQDTVFPDEDAIRSAVDSGVDFICRRGYRNVVLEVANEVMEGHYHHDILKPGRVTELIHQARERAGNKHGHDLLVSTSEAGLLNSQKWNREQIDTVFDASDFILCHGGDDLDHGKIGDTSIVVDKIEFIQSRPWYRKRPRPIIFNESDGRQALKAAARHGVSFGLHSGKYIQNMWPPRWGVWHNPTLWFYRAIRELTGAPGGMI